MSPFILDSNFFIQAHRSNYPFDVVPSFWIKIQQLANQNLIVSIDKVRDEIFRNDDELTDWCQRCLPTEFFKDSSVAINEYSTLASWANSRSDHFQQRAIEEFLDTDAADAWIIAYAMNQNIPLLTHEKSEPERKSRIKIPDVCLVYGVNYFTTVEMLRNLGETI
jgi:hypothetical protein